MILDFVPSTGAYTLTVPRSSGVDVKALVEEHGLDFSIPASTAENAVLFTREPYAAASFSNMATPAAADALAPLLREIEASWAPDSPSASLALRTRNYGVSSGQTLGTHYVEEMYWSEISRAWERPQLLYAMPMRSRLNGY